MKFVLPLALTATPALAHEGIHMHPHGSENWIAGVLLIGTCLIVAAAKHLISKRAEQRA
ncbi:hypothetical protein [Cognatishimia activa]|uniref:hypothetical protein n=1 Tax=Cognatishimia activa TaxID=1715691 RepID=UPI00223062C5|nr:hypothetical protein [Cognatishimia activa]UZD91461.1 hypothetical protein M0D42_02245 [Cognatishimia activa]